jgi:hypothetical protein
MQRDFDPEEPELEPDFLSLDPEAPEADAIEQLQAATPLDSDPFKALPPDASEADALEQSRSVPLDDWDE